MDQTYDLSFFNKKKKNVAIGKRLWSMRNKALQDVLLLEK